MVNQLIGDLFAAGVERTRVFFASLDTLVLQTLQFAVFIGLLEQFFFGVQHVASLFVRNSDTAHL